MEPHIVEQLHAGATASDYDYLYAVIDHAPVLAGLWSRAWQDEFDPEVEAFGTCSRWLLREMAAALPVRPDEVLVDLGCGRGGPGLWLARTLSARLIGVDFSEVAVELAAERADRFLPSGRASFRTGRFDRTGLPDAVAHAVISVDALKFAADLGAALDELHRILAPGGRVVFTAAPRPQREPDWAELGARAGLILRTAAVHAGNAERWRRLYALWLDHAEQLRAELGDAVAGELLHEAERAGRQSGPPDLLLVFDRPAGD